jgi:quinol monooxygenase YgiN
MSKSEMTRRALVAGATVLGTTTTVTAATMSDVGAREPIFAVIEECKQAELNLDAVLEELAEAEKRYWAHNPWRDQDAAAMHRARDAADAVGERLNEAIKTFVETVPATASDLVAAIEYVHSTVKEDSATGVLMEQHIVTFLESIRLAVQRGLAG